MKKFDFNCANRQVGADDKQNYCGKPKLYFEIETLNNA
jgi:hypothetical protein|tara:strand:- start:436 stop:549 length:114 start_codon:yes stop_codon:yes gene_type:complete